MPEEQEVWTSSQKILVRGPDGHLYALSATSPPQQLTAQEELAAANLIDQTEEQFTQALNTAVPGYNFGKSQVRGPQM